MLPYWLEFGHMFKCFLSSLLTTDVVVNSIHYKYKPVELFRL